MTIRLFTPMTQFTADLMDVVRLFFVTADCELTDEAHATLIHRFCEEGNEWVCEFDYQGHHADHRVPKKGTTPIEIKRNLKRLIKQVLYDLLKEITHIHPPWGSLTGVRPAKLIYEQLERGKTLDEAQSFLETKFDVSSDKAALIKRIVKTQLTLPKPVGDEADVYIGIPFCPSRCAYCSFSSGEIGNGKQVAPYLKALAFELYETAALMHALKLKLRCVYVGGGTPSSLNEKDFAWLITQIKQCFPNPVELTVEAGRPDSITREKLLTLRNAHVSRISINPQTMNDQTLKIIGRNHTKEDVYRAYDLAREVGINHINMDVIAGLPGESLDDFALTMQAARALKPESLTVHTLAIKRSSKMQLQAAKLPDGDLTRKMVHMGEMTAQSMNLSPYYLYRQKYMAGNQENVGYALSGHACLYNVDMMEETSHIFGIGAGAMSKRLVGTDSRIERAPNVSDILTYIDRVNEMLNRKKQLWNMNDW